MPVPRPGDGFPDTVQRYLNPRWHCRSGAPIFRLQNQARRRISSPPLTVLS